MEIEVPKKMSYRHSLKNIHVHVLQIKIYLILFFTLATNNCLLHNVRNDQAEVNVFSSNNDHAVKFGPPSHA